MVQCLAWLGVFHFANSLHPVLAVKEWHNAQRCSVMCAHVSEWPAYLAAWHVTSFIFIFNSGTRDMHGKPICIWHLADFPEAEQAKLYLAFSIVAGVWPARAALRTHAALHAMSVTLSQSWATLRKAVTTVTIAVQVGCTHTNRKMCLPEMSTPAWHNVLNIGRSCFAHRQLAHRLASTQLRGRVHWPLMLSTNFGHP